MELIQETNIWRTYSKVLDNRISIELPKNTDIQEVEIIIIPKKRKTVSNNNIRNEECKNDFLTISQWNISVDDIRMNSWKIQEF